MLVGVKFAVFLAADGADSLCGAGGFSALVGAGVSAGFAGSVYPVVSLKISFGGCAAVAFAGAAVAVLACFKGTGKIVSSHTVGNFAGVLCGAVFAVIPFALCGFGGVAVAGGVFIGDIVFKNVSVFLRIVGIVDRLYLIAVFAGDRFCARLVAGGVVVCFCEIVLPNVGCVPGKAANGAGLLSAGSKAVVSFVFYKAASFAGSFVVGGILFVKLIITHYMTAVVVNADLGRNTQGVFAGNAEIAGAFATYGNVGIFLRIIAAVGGCAVYIISDKSARFNGFMGTYDLSACLAAGYIGTVARSHKSAGFWLPVGNVTFNLAHTEAV